MSDNEDAKRKTKIHRDVHSKRSKTLIAQKLIQNMVSKARGIEQMRGEEQTRNFGGISQRSRAGIHGLPEQKHLTSNRVNSSWNDVAGQRSRSGRNRPGSLGRQVVTSC